MRCPKCFEKVTHDTLFDVYDCDNGCGNTETLAVKSFGFEREEVLTEKEFRGYMRKGY